MRLVKNNRRNSTTRTAQGQWPNKLNEARRDPAKKEELAEHCSSNSDDALLLRKELLCPQSSVAYCAQEINVESSL